MIDSYTGLPWCGAGLHLLEEGKNASRRANGLLCLRCQARQTRQKRERAVRGVTWSCTAPDCTEPGPYPTARHLGAHRRHAHGPGFRRVGAPENSHERTA